MNKTEAKEILKGIIDSFKGAKLTNRQSDAINDAIEFCAAPPPASEGELTEGQFCKLHSAMHGEEIDHVDQLVFSRMTGRELYEFVKFCVATLPTMEPEGEGVSM